MKAINKITCPDHQIESGKFCHFLIEPKERGDKSLCGHQSHFLCDEVLKYEYSRVSHSSIQDFMQCPKRDYYRNICGLERIDETMSSAVKMGNVWEATLRDFFEIIPNEKIKEESDKQTYLNILEENPLTQLEQMTIQSLLSAFNDKLLTLPSGLWQQKQIVMLQDQLGIQCPVSLVYDILMPDNFAEIKLTKNFSYHDNAWNVQDQVGLYLACNPKMKYGTVYATLRPEFKLGKETKDKKAETLEEYGNRVYNAAINDPCKYFLGYNSKDRTWGKRFYRADFDLEAIKLRAIEISKQRRTNINNNYFFMNTKNCFMYGRPCEYLSICQNQGNINEDYRVREHK